MREYRLGDAIRSNKGGDDNGEEIVVQSDNTRNTEGECNSSRPTKQVKGLEEHASVDTEIPFALDDGVDCETIGPS